MDKFPSTTTLWLVLRKFESGGPETRNFTARAIAKLNDGDTGAGRLCYEGPVLNILGKDYSSFTDLQKTFSTLGLSTASVLVRLNFRASDIPFEEAQGRISQYFKEVDGQSGGGSVVQQKSLESASTTSTSDQQNIEPTTRPPLQPELETVKRKADREADKMPSTSASSSSPVPEALPGVTARPITVFAAPSSTTPQAALTAHNPNDYEHTLEHVKRQKANYEIAGRNKTLPSYTDIEAAAAAASAQRASVKSVDIKIRFPDQTTVVASFTSSDTGQDLYSWVRSLMRCGNESFALRRMGPKSALSDVPDSNDQLIQKIGMMGREQLTMVWREGASAEARRGPCLKTEVNQRARQIEVKEVEGSEAVEEKEVVEKKEKGKEGASSERQKKLMGLLKKNLPGGRK